MHWKLRGWTLIGMLLVTIPGVMTLTKVTVAAQTTSGSGIGTTQVTDTVYRADGTPANGSVIVSWQAFSTASGQAVPSGTTSAPITNGALSLQLVPNAGSTPMGTYYTAVYHLDDGSVSREFWVVPVNQYPVLVSAIRSTVLPTSVAMQTVSKSYVDTAIAAAVTGHPLDSTPYVLKAGDTMTGALVLPGDPTTTNEAANKHYVDVNIAATTGGLGQKVSLLPSGTQAVAQPVGTQLQVNNLNGAEYASQYVTGLGNNGIANAAASPDCVSGCDIKVERSYPNAEHYPALNSGTGGTHIEDSRNGGRRDIFLNPTSPSGDGTDAGQVIDVTSTRSTAAEFAGGGSQEPSSFGLVIKHEGFTGGSNLFPQSLGNVPYFKTNYNAISVTGTYNTMGQHALDTQAINCYGVGDCLIGSQFINSSGGFRDEADEGAHPYDLQIREDSAVFQGTCSQGCTSGSTTVTIAANSAAGTEGEGRYLIDKNPAKVIATGVLTGGTGLLGGVPGAGATFSGTNFPVSVFLATAQLIPPQANNVAPGTVTVAIATSGVNAGFATNTAAVPSPGGVACVTDQTTGSSVHNYEMANYSVVDGAHLQMTLNKPHRAGATIAFGGLCGYGLEQTVDTVGPIRQVFPVIGSYSATGLYYAGGLTSIVGIQSNVSAFLNVTLQIAAIARNNGVVTITTAGSMPVDVNGLTMNVAGVSDQSYNGSFTVTSTGSNTLTYSQTGANSTSTGGTVAKLTGGYVLYPMAEVLGVYDAVAKSIDGQLTLAPNTVPWAANDAVEEPHYYQQLIGTDATFVGQTTPRPTITQAAGVQYESNVGPGMNGWTVANAVPAANYLGNGGTHSPPHAAFQAQGIWQRTMDMQAGEESVFSVHCNSHSCGRWNSGYNLFELDSSAGVDSELYQPGTSTLLMNFRGSSYQFSPQAFTAGTINAGTINVTRLNAQLSAAQLPVVVGSGVGHSAGAVPDPGPTAGTTRYLREDGTWASVSASGGATTTQLTTNLLTRYALAEGSGAPQDSSGNGNHASLPGGGTNPVWTAQGISCDGVSQYFNAPGTTGARSFVWATTASVPLDAPVQAGPQFVIPFGLASNSLLFGGDAYYGNHPSIAQSGSFNNTSDSTLQGTHVFALTLGTNTGSDPDRFYIDGVETTYNNGRTASAASSTGNFTVCGVPTGFPTYFPGSFYYWEAYSDEKSATDLAKETEAVRNIVSARGVSFKTQLSASPKDLYVAIGDSLTNGEGVTPSSASITPTDSFDVVNHGLGNSDTDDLFLLFDARDAILFRPNAGRNVARFWIGSNDVSTRSRTAQQALDGVRSLCRKAKLAGFQTILSDMISRTGHDTDMLTLNALLTTQDTGCDLVLDLASNPLLGAAGANTNATNYQGDNTHLTETGQLIIAGAETRAINLLGQLKNTGTSPTVTSATYTLADYDQYLPVSPTANSIAATLPDCNYFTGMTRSIKNLQSSGANTVTVAPASGQLIDGSASPITVANGATLVLRQIVPNRTTAGCTWVKVSNN